MTVHTTTQASSSAPSPIPASGELNTCIALLDHAMRGTDEELDSVIERLTTIEVAAPADKQLLHAVLWLAGQAMRSRVEAAFASVH